MRPIEPVAPGFDLTNVRFAESQPEYETLPAYRSEDGMVVTRWRLTWRERFLVFLTGDLWLSILTCNRPLQPVKLDTKCPIFGHYMGDKEL